MPGPPPAANRPAPDRRPARQPGSQRQTQIAPRRGHRSLSRAVRYAVGRPRLCERSRRDGAGTRHARSHDPRRAAARTPRPLGGAQGETLRPAAPSPETHPWPNAGVAARRSPAAACPINSGSRPPNRSSASSKKCSVSGVYPCAVGPKPRRMGVGLPRLRLQTPPPPRRRPPPTSWPPAQETCLACPFPPPVFTRQEFRNLQARQPARRCRREDAPHADDQPCGHGSPHGKFDRRGRGPPAGPQGTRSLSQAMG